MSDALLIRLLMFEPCLEPQEAFIPPGADVVDPLLKLAEGFGRQGIALFPPFLMHGNQAHTFKDRQMLENSLPRDWVFSCKLGRRLGAVFSQIHQQAPAYWISQRGEDGLLVIGVFAQARRSTPPNTVPYP